MSIEQMRDAQCWMHYLPTDPEPILAATKNQLRKVESKTVSPEALLVSHEEVDDFHSFRQAYFMDLCPVGMLEIQMVERIVAVNWRLKRLLAIESDLIDMDCLVDESRRILTYNRVERNLSQEFYRAARELKRLQRERLKQEQEAPSGAGYMNLEPPGMMPDASAENTATLPAQPLRSARSAARKRTRKYGTTPAALPDITQADDAWKVLIEAAEG